MEDRPVTADPHAAPTVEPSEAEMLAAIIDAGRMLGWRCAHFRPARTGRGWRTAVAGDGAGFPDLVLAHPVAKRVLFVELKSAKGRLARDQEAWAATLIQAGAEWMAVRGRAGLTQFLEMLADVPAGRPQPSGAMLDDILGRAMP
jgi:VRR-NUC domain